MDPFTIALATFGVQKLRGKSTRTALKDAALIGGGAAALGPSGLGAFKNFGSMSGGPFSSLTGMFSTTPATSGQDPNFLQKIIGRPEVTAKESVIDKATNQVLQPAVKAQTGTGLRGFYSKLGTGEKIGLGLAGTTLLSGMDQEDPEMPKGTRPEDYEAAQKAAKEQLEGGFEAAEYEAAPNQNIYDYADSDVYTFNQGGIVNALPKYNQGGINYLPSKTDHDEKDVNNYVRATGYVEDGSGNGDKDEDTMLAQLADGEFVSRADAILGAGIMEGASPKDMKAMRRKGAAFFYDQQAKFKRVYDLLNASRKDN